MNEQFQNLTEKEELKTNLLKVFSDLEKILLNHAGPFATNAVVGSKYRQVNDIDEFTKDGIKIFVHLIVTEDVVARFATRLTRFIGICVDHRCHDGTTTSMLLFARLAMMCLRRMDTDLNDRMRYLFVHRLIGILNENLNLLDVIKITEEDIYQKAVDYGIDTTLEDIRGAIAYHMSMISSKGDHQLSTMVAKLIKYSPKKIYGLIGDSNLAVETEEHYMLNKQPYDMAVKCQIGNHNDYNSQNDTIWESDDCMIFASANDIVIGSWESNFLTSFISKIPKYRQGLLEDFGVEHGWEHYHENKKHLIIVTHLLADPTLIEVINYFNKEHPTHKISWFTVPLHPRVKSTWNKTIHYTAGKEIFQDVMHTNAMASIIGSDGRKIKAKYIGRVLELYNLYEKDGNVYHPFVNDPELFPSYTKFKEETEKTIEFANSNITNPSLDQKELAEFVSLYRTLTCQEIYDIDVGGSVHTQKANKTVYEDALGAALSAIDEGVVFGGYLHLAKHMKDLGEEELANILYSVVADSVRTDTDNVVKLHEGTHDDKWTYLVADPEKYLSLSEDYYTLEVFDKNMIEQFLLMEKGKPILFQAWSGYVEQFRRFKDIIPKLANSTNLIDMRLNDASSVA